MGIPSQDLAKNRLFWTHNIANLQDIDFISHSVINPYMPSNEGRSVLRPLEKWNNSEELLEEKGVGGSHKGNATSNKCLWVAGVHMVPMRDHTQPPAH